MAIRIHETNNIYDYSAYLFIYDLFAYSYNQYFSYDIRLIRNRYR